MSAAMIWYRLDDTTLSGLDASQQAVELAGNASTFAFQSLQHPPTTSSSAKIATDHTPPPVLRALAYGDGFFTTMGVYQGQILWWSYHLARIKSHCEALQLHMTETAIQQLDDLVHRLAKAAQHGVIKVIVSRQAQHLRGYAYSPDMIDNGCLIWVGVDAGEPLANQQAEFICATPESGSDNMVLLQPAIVATSLQSRLACVPPPLAGLKTLNRLDSVLIAGELQRYRLENSELAEGLVQDMMGHWVEGVMSNVFYQLTPSVNEGGTGSSPWYTPPIESSGVRGVMRQVIMDRMEAQGTPAVERVLQDTDMEDITAMFFCNAVRGVIPVKRLVLQSQSLALRVETYSKAD